MHWPSRQSWPSGQLPGSQPLLSPFEPPAPLPVASPPRPLSSPAAAPLPAVLEAGTEPLLRAKTDARVMLLGGAPLDGHRHVWWNFVSSSRERIEQAKADWREGRIGQVAGETGFIPLPER